MKVVPTIGIGIYIILVILILTQQDSKPVVKNKKVLASVDEDAWKGYISYGYAPELYLSALKKPKDGKGSR